MSKITKWIAVSRKVIFQKYGRKIEEVIFKMPDGKESDFYLKKEGTAVCVFALTKDSKVVMTRQYRPGPDEILSEMPGGVVEEGESPEQAGARELLEETGYKGNAEFVTWCWDCAYSTMHRACVIVTDCELVSEQTLDENEYAEIILMDVDEFRELLRSGQMTDVEIGYLALDHLKLL